MNIFVLDTTVTGDERRFPDRLGNLCELLNQIPGIAVVPHVGEADLVIVVADNLDAGQRQSVAYQLEAGKRLWYFYPRGTVVNPVIVGAILEIRDKFGQELQRVFAYDSTAHIVSWVGSSYTKCGSLAAFV